MEKFSDLPGHTDLTKYKSENHRGGIALFRAYIKHREANQKNYDQRKKALIKNCESGLALDEFEKNLAEVLLLNILEELDPIIRDLLTFCKNPGKPDDQLPNLRSALRIGKGHSPYDSDLKEKQWEVEMCWITAYLTMQDDRIYRSQSKIADEICQKLGVSKSTAIKHWKDFCEKLPHQQKWAERITSIAKAMKESAPIKKTKPKHWNKPRISFGKKRTN